MKVLISQDLQAILIYLCTIYLCPSPFHKKGSFPQHQRAQHPGSSFTFCSKVSRMNLTTHFTEIYDSGQNWKDLSNEHKVRQAFFLILVQMT